MISKSNTKLFCRKIKNWAEEQAKHLFKLLGTQPLQCIKN